MGNVPPSKKGMPQWMLALNIVGGCYLLLLVVVGIAVQAAKNSNKKSSAPATTESAAFTSATDSDAARGKRLCATGSIVRIEEVKLPNGGELAEGLLKSDAGNVYDFIAAGSLGDLVQNSYARICGVVAGNHDSSNGAGGEGHAVSLVGMFDPHP